VRTRRLIVVTPEGERELLFIGRLTVGRAPECDISLADTKISRRHAEFDASGPTPRVTDLGSRNGILVNGRKVGAADLVVGDVITVGDAQIRFEERAVETAERTAAPITDDRTAVLSPLMPPGSPVAPTPAVADPAPPARVAAEPAPSTPEVAVASAPPMSADPDKTSVLPRQAGAAAPPVPPRDVAPAPPSVDGASDRTMVLPPPARGAVAAPPPVAQDPVRTARLDGTPAASPASAAPQAPAPPPAARPLWCRRLALPRQLRRPLHRHLLRHRLRCRHRRQPCPRQCRPWRRHPRRQRVPQLAQPSPDRGSHGEAS
jgi:pSer/pThr/pTyr-binding forkhead associated (FHA) protein